MAQTMHFYWSFLGITSSYVDDLRLTRTQIQQNWCRRSSENGRKHCEFFWNALSDYLFLQTIV